MIYFRLFLLFLLTLSLSSQRVEEYKVCTWNIQNWGITDRFVEGRFQADAMKPESEIKSVLAILKRIQPDILGVSEILQSPQDQFLKHFENQLKNSGFDFPYMATVRGSDTRIQCALFSKFPITQQLNHDNLQFEVTRKKDNQQREKSIQGLLRGLLHVKIQVTPHYSLEVMQVHLKSKRPDPTLESDTPDEDGDDFVRRQESILIKNAMNRVLEANPQTNLLLMGDLNDGSRSKTFKNIVGPKNADHRTFDLWLQDGFGDWWTHFYFPDKKYERIDYMVVSQGLMKDWIKEKSYIYRSRENDSGEYNVSNASDHRPLVSVFKKNDR